MENCGLVTICASRVALCHKKSAKLTRPNYAQTVNKLELLGKNSLYYYHHDYL